MPASKPEQDLRHFNEAAATWDENPHQRAMTEAIAQGIRETVPLLAQAGLRIIHKQPAGAGGLLKIALLHKGGGLSSSLSVATALSGDFASALRTGSTDGL